MGLPKIIQEVLNRVSFAGAQTLTDAQKAQARTNIGAIDDTNVVTLDTEQTITGEKTFNASILLTGSIRKTTTDTYLNVSGGTTGSNGAVLTLNGNDRSGNEGRFSLYTGKINNVRYALTGIVDGSLTWGGNDVLTSANGVTLDTAQTITGAKSFGTMTINADGTFGKTVTTSVLRQRGGTNNATGAYLGLFGSDHSASAGVFEFVTGVTGGNASRAFRGYPNGSLQWDSKEIERVSELGTGYIRYESGLQICFGEVTLAANTTTNTVTFAAPFTDRNAYSLSFVRIHGSDPLYIPAGGSNLANTGFTVEYPSSASAGYFRWIAIGTWK